MASGEIIGFRFSGRSKPSQAHFFWLLSVFSSWATDAEIDNTATAIAVNLFMFIVVGFLLVLAKVCKKYLIAVYAGQKKK